MEPTEASPSRQLLPEPCLDLSTIIVSWNVRKHLERCLSSIYARPIEGLGLETWMVDNASTDGSVEMVREFFPQVKVIPNQVNLGFTRANNQAIGESRGRYILLLNPDAQVMGGALGAMVAHMETHPRLAALGPRLLNPDGTVQSSRRRFPTLATGFLESTTLQQWFPHSRTVRSYYLEDRAEDEAQGVDWVTGACIMLRRQALETVGLLDEDFFMYSEELDWCHRAKAAGWEVGYLPDAQVIHHGGQSSAQELPARHIHFQQSKLTFFRKHHGRWQAEALRAFLLLCYGLQLLAECVKWLLRHKPALRRQRVAAYWQVLRSGLKARS